MKSRGLQPKLLYPAKLSLKIEGQIKNSPERKKLKEFISNKPLLYEMFKETFKKKIQTMNHKMVINTYLSTTDSKKQTKQTRSTETESWIRRAF